MKKITLCALMAACALSWASPSHAADVLFDFENATLGQTSSLSQTVNGETITVTRQNGTAFEVYNIGSSVPGFGSRSLGPFNDMAANAFVFNFSSLLTGISLQAGDFAPSDPDDFLLSIYTGANGTGTLLGTASASQTGNTGFPTFANLSFSSSTAFGSAVFIGGSSSFPNSVFFDNVRVQTGGAVPEPGTWAMMLIGFGAIGFSMRRRRMPRKMLKIA